MSILPPKLPKRPKRESRWRSPAHLAFVRTYACSRCGSHVGIEAAHVRIGSGAGMGQRPHDYLAVSLCRDCHTKQHRVGEATFWAGRDLQELIQAFCDASPKAHEIRRVKAERESGG